MSNNRPKYLNLLKIHQPIPAITSILHRASGVALFIGLPFLLWLLSSSISQQESFDVYHATLKHPIVKIFFLLFLWAFLHHLLAGIRFLLLDIHQGLKLKTARLTAKLVLFGAPLLTFMIGSYLLW